jgi:hypothetical protein
VCAERQRDNIRPEPRSNDSTLRASKLAEAGVEHTTDSSDKTAYEPERAAFLRAISTVCGPNFAEIVAVWPSLPDALKADILAMVRAAGDAG